MITFRPLSTKTWDDFEELFGSRGACGGCWCMSWRLEPKEFEKGKGKRNRAAMKRLAAAKRSPGIIAYVDGRPAGWCAAAPRDAYPRLARSRVLRPLDETPVWSVSCFFIAKEFRRRGLSVRLLRAVIDWARASGAEALEGYPVIPYAADMPAAFAWTGLLDSYLRAGFKEMPRWSEARPIVRFALTPGRRRKQK